MAPERRGNYRDLPVEIALNKVRPYIKTFNTEEAMLDLGQTIHLS
jgi:hypothetical protein